MISLSWVLETRLGSLVWIRRGIHLPGLGTEFAPDVSGGFDVDRLYDELSVGTALGRTMD